MLVIDRRRHPVPQAAHKVGESSVEIAAHYFGKVLGLEDMLPRRQLKKFGFRFFFSDGAEQIEDVTELGASTFLTTPSYQLDRGIFENDLGALVRERGVRFVDGATVRDFRLGDGGPAAPRAATTTPPAPRRPGALAGRRQRPRRPAQAQARPGQSRTTTTPTRCGFASARASTSTNGPTTRPGWRAATRRKRWLSTNHLVGEGYWVWLIPLASGSHSVGIVADATLHPLETMNTFEKAMTWLAKHQPRLHADLQGKRDKLQDFAFFKRFSYGCRQVYDGNSRWALTGEAGLFLDPFYSPGGDFIGISNTYVTELDRAGPRRQAHRHLRRGLPAPLLLVLRGHAADLQRPVPACSATPRCCR